jgi:hypothetical protein
MLGRVSAILAAASAAAVGAGCAEEPLPAIGPGVHAGLAGAQIATIGSPGPQDLPFGEALITYSRELARIHAFEGETADERLGWEVRQLATVLERMPAAAQQRSLRRAAAQMRAAEADAEPSIEDTQRTLAAAAIALLQLARTSYAAFPEIAAATRAVAGAVSAIDAGRKPPDRPGVIFALLRFERALAAMYAVNVAPSQP